MPLTSENSSASRFLHSLSLALSELWLLPTSNFLCVFISILLGRNLSYGLQTCIIELSLSPFILQYYVCIMHPSGSFNWKWLKTWLGALQFRLGASLDTCVTVLEQHLSFFCSYACSSSALVLKLLPSTPSQGKERERCVNKSPAQTTVNPLGGVAVRHIVSSSLPNPSPLSPINIDQSTAC